VRVSYRSRTRVFGRWKGVFLLPVRMGVPDLDVRVVSGDGEGSTLVSPTYSSWIPVEYSGIHWNPLEYTYVWIFSFLSTIF